ncbi:MAG: NfeD family protein [Faecalibacterium sp.]|nr:NfeD family protein [Faecalibacterium sp.]
MTFDKLSIFWLIAMVALLILEGATVNMVSIWFAIGACAALIVSLFCGNIGVQLAVFVVVSLIALALTKPLVARLRRATPDTPTNGDRNIGRECVVIEAISPEKPGRVRLDGVDWTARCADAPLAVGARCRVASIESTVLVVEAVPQPAVVQ